MKYVLLLVCLTFNSLVGKAAGREGVVRLKERAGVAGEAIRLSDLLPADAPAQVRALAMGVELGRSPHLGSPRILSGEQITRHLNAHPDWLALFSIPDHVTVVRQGWPIKPDLIRQTIFEFATKQNWSLGSESSLTLLWSGSPHALIDNPALTVHHADQDNLRHQLRFAVGCVNKQTCGTFLVSARLPANFSRGGQMGAASGTKPGARKRREILAYAGKPAMLTMDDGNIRILLRVICLDSGSLGQTIRTRQANSHRIFSAEVVGAGSLRASL